MFNPQERQLLYPGQRLRVFASCFPDNAESLVVRRHEAPPLDCHNYRELTLILSGSAELRLLDKVYAADAGCVFLFDSHGEHDCGYSPGAPPGRHLWIYPLPDAFSCGIVEVGNEGLSNSLRQLQRAPALMVYLNSAWLQCKQSPSFANQERLLRVLELLFTEAAILLEGQASESPSQDSRRQAMEAVQQHINASLGAGDSIESLARLVGYSRVHFQRLFQQYAGCPVGEYINRVRLSALRQLENSGLMQKEIAAKLGFSGAASLAHWRKRQQR